MSLFTIFDRVTDEIFMVIDHDFHTTAFSTIKRP